MSLFIIVHHPQNPEPTQWTNVWSENDNNLLESITTPTKVGEYCYEAKRKGERVYVHRCGWEDSNPVVCCSVKVLQVTEIDKFSSYVIFGDQQVIGKTTPQSAHEGQNFYFDKLID